MFPLLKRLSDFLFALIGILIASPILAVAIVILRLTGEGKVFFVQDRVGYKNQLFKIYKFTTMLSAAPEQKNKTNIGKRDPRITPIGAFFRMTKVDELPQLFNVLKGDMSFVGPRALMKVPDFESYPEEVKATIYNVRPGVTGIGSVVFRDEAQLISQVKDDGKDAGDFKQKVIFDYKGRVEMWYNENQSFLVDLKILLLTAWTLIFPSSQLAFRLFPGLPEKTDALKIEFDRMLQLKESITLLALVVAVLIPIIPPPFWFLNHWQFILMAVIPVFYFTYTLFRKNEIPVKIERGDVGWLIFISLCFLSYFWAINGGLVWYQAFGFLCLLMWMLLFRSLTGRDSSNSIMPMLFAFFFLVVMVYHIWAIVTNVPTDENWNYFFGKNAMYTSCFLVSLYPFLLFYEGRYRLVHIVKTIFTFAILFVLLITDAQWASIAFLLVLLYYGWTHLPRGIFWNVFTGLVCTFVLVGIMGYYNPEFLQKLPVIKQYVALGTHFKTYLLEAALSSASENPILGTGLGNFHLAIYQNDFSEIGVFNNATTFTRYRSHNIFTKYLVEIGLVGLLAFLYSIGILLKRSLSYKKQLDGYEQAAFASLLVFLFTAFFYADVNFYEYHFSVIHLLAFCSIGILSSKNSEKFYTLPARANGIFLVLSLICLTWFAYARYSFKVFFETKQQLSEQNIEPSIQQLEALYHPVFNTNHDYWQSIPLEIGKLYQAKGDADAAQKWYQLAVEQNPSNETVLLAYAQFLGKDQQDLAAAKQIAQFIYKRQPNHFELNLLLAELAVAEGKFKEAATYLKVFDGVKKHNFGERLLDLQQLLVDNS